MFHCQWYLILHNHRCTWSLNVCRLGVPLNSHLHELAVYTCITILSKKGIYFAKIVTQNILSQGTSNLQIDFKYQSRRNYQYLIISITFTCVPVYWVSNLPVWGHRVPGFLSHTEFHPRYSVPKWSPRNKENIIKSLSKHGKWCMAYFRYELSNNFLFFYNL